MLVYFILYMTYWLGFIMIEGFFLTLLRSKGNLNVGRYLGIGLIKFIYEELTTSFAASRFSLPMPLSIFVNAILGFVQFAAIYVNVLGNLPDSLFVSAFCLFLILNIQDTSLAPVQFLYEI